MNCRLWLDPPAAGDWNMAFDEMLLDEASQQPAACWRFYRWSEPTVSLGYFQSYRDRREHAASRDCRLVRRLTGGGAIVHDREITYSLILPCTHRLARGRDLLYRLVHTALIAALKEFSIEATLCPGGAVAEEPFLCFQRRAAGDVLVGAAKIAGSAQRRRRGAVLQQGSVLLQCSRAAPELPGLEELARVSVPAEQLMSIWQERLAVWLELDFVPAATSEQQRHSAADLARRYADDAWNRKR